MTRLLGLALIALAVLASFIVPGSRLPERLIGLGIGLLFGR